MLTTPEATHLTVPHHLDADRKLIYDALGAVPDYGRYHSSEEVEQRFDSLHERHQHGENGVRVRFDDIPIGHSPDAPTRRLWIVEPASLDAQEAKDLPNAFVPGNGHTSEVIWTLTYDYLPQALCQRPELLRALGHRFLFWDMYPQGMAANGDALFEEASITPEFLMNNLGRAHIVPDWELGVQYKKLDRTSTLPDAQALEYIIDTYRPVYGQPLHNTLVNSFMYTTTRGEHAFYDDILQLRQAIQPSYPAGTAGSDLNYAETLATGIYHGIDAQTLYEDYTKTTGSEEAAMAMIGGNNVPGYMVQKVPGSMGVNDESGYFASEALANSDGTALAGAIQPRLRREMVGHVAAHHGRIMRHMQDILTQVDAAPIDLNRAQRLQYGCTERLYDYWSAVGPGTFEQALEGHPVAQNTWPDLLNNTVFFPAIGLGSARRLAASLHMDKLTNRAGGVLKSCGDTLQQMLALEPVSRRAQVAMQAGSIMLGALASKRRRLSS
ncbi:MAG TPA: hypothetical protein VD735_04245 [Candidatus Saccharimonadales bacterium]|nr:hypothetical protein [Candidatus Saccharimonadales bacterium]